MSKWFVDPWSFRLIPPGRSVTFRGNRRTVILTTGRQNIEISYAGGNKARRNTGSTEYDSGTYETTMAQRRWDFIKKGEIVFNPSKTYLVIIEETTNEIPCRLIKHLQSYVADYTSPLFTTTVDEMQPPSEAIQAQITKGPTISWQLSAALQLSTAPWKDRPSRSK